MYLGKTVGVILPAAGRSVRFGGPKRKQFLEIGNRQLWEFSLGLFQAHEAVDSIVLVVPSDALDEVRNHRMIAGNSRTEVVAGGIQRQDSVWNGLAALMKGKLDYVLVHDAVRPCLGRDLVDRLMAVMVKTRATIPVISPSDTIRILEDGGLTSRIVPREQIRLVQTPQAFETELLFEALKQAFDEHLYATDEATLVERLGVAIDLVEGDPFNMKATRTKDLAIIEAILMARDTKLTSS